MMKTRIFALVLALMLALSMTAFAEGTLPLTTEEGASVSMLAMNSWYSTVDLSDALLLNELQSRANVKIEWNLIDPTIYSDTVSPMLASGQDLPDIIQLPDTDNNMTYLSTGMFIKLDEYMDIMPNYSAFLEKNPTIKAALTAVDGHIYYVPQTVVTSTYQPVMMYNMPWIEKLGIEPPTTLDAFVEMLRMFRDQDMNGNGDTTDEIPMSIMSAFLPYMFGPAFGMDLVSGFYADDEGVVHYAAYEPEKYKNYLTFLNDLYNEGLLEVEFTSLNRDKITERCANDLTGVTYDYSWQMSNLYSAQYPNYDGTKGIIVGAKPLSGEYPGAYIGRNPVSGVFGINAKSDKIELAVKMLDYVMSEEAQDLYVWGMEGLTYEVKDGERAYLPRCTEDTIWYQGLGINAPNMPSQQSAEATAVLLAPWHVQAIAEKEAPYARAPFPNVYSTEDEVSTISMYLTDLTTYVDERAVAFICGYASIEDEFDSYIETLKGMQVEELIKVKQAQYDRFAAAMK